MGSGTLLKPAASEPCSSLHVQMQIKTIRQKNPEDPETLLLPPGLELIVHGKKTGKSRGLI